MNPSASTTWKHLAPNPKSAYKQLFVSGTRIRARILYGMFMSDEEPMTPEEIASEFNLPLEAVQEAIAYCQSDPPEIKEDFEREEAEPKAGPESAGDTTEADELARPTPVISPHDRFPLL